MRSPFVLSKLLNHSSVFLQFLIHTVHP